MTTSFDKLDAEREIFTYAPGPYIREHNNNCHKHVLKSKENVLKLKFCRSLKRKLKKYKIRRDGFEDPDVLDVSQIFLKSLKIKSPRSLKNRASHGVNEDEFVRPKNYLFKMGRHKKQLKSENTLKDLAEVNCIDKSSHYNMKQNNQTSDSVSNGPNNGNNSSKKQKNAFQFMMDSRNKSIGSNSPGKEKVIDNIELHEIVEKQTLKVKRQLVLQKMAEAKGSLKKKEVDDNHDEYIKKRLDARAERFKQSITKSEKSSKKLRQDSKQEQKLLTQPCTANEKELSKTLQIINIFEEPIHKASKKPTKKEIVVKEDEDFLKKLSPSMKKKENMLCYFKKLEKDCESSPELDTDDVQVCTPNIIKVKFTPKTKKKKKKKMSLNKITYDDQRADFVKIDHDPKIEINHCSQTVLKENLKQVDNSPIISSERKKRKRNMNSNDFLKSDFHTECEKSVNSRPKRNVTKPLKYLDELENFSSSDEEYLIFTPKKKKIVEKSTQNNSELAKSVKEVNKNSHSSNPVEKNAVDEKKAPLKKKPTKLASIFTTKVQDLVALEARQKFLQSGVPDQLKKVISRQQNKANVTSYFPTVVHVQQLKHDIKQDNNCTFNLKFNSVNEESELDENNVELQFTKLVNINATFSICKFKQPLSNVQTVLINMKKGYPKFPVYRTYRMLKDRSKGNFSDCTFSNLDNSIEVVNGILEGIKNEDPDNLIWTDKYKAMSASQIIGNFESIKELKKWLVSWRESEVVTKTKPGYQSDSSDFCLSDAETDSMDSQRSTNNLLILSGPVGCGKTSSIYAVAAELGIKVIEVNVSSRRTGKIMLQDLQEATQSHKVNRKKENSSAENSQQSQEVANSQKIIKKRGRPKKATENLIKTSQSSISNELSRQEVMRTCMSLILVDDADIVFDQDDGFCSAITQLAQCSKRPVVLVTSSLSCPHLQKFVQCGKVIKMQPLIPRLLGTWLDLMCLADTGQCCPGIGENFLDYFKGDIRRTINYLHFCFQASKEYNIEDSEDYKLNVDDECSSMSWTNSTDIDDKLSRANLVSKEPSTLDYTWSCFMGNETNIQSTSIQDLGKIYWNLPNILHQRNDNEVVNKSKNHAELEAICRVMENFSIADCFSNIVPDEQGDLYSQPFYSSESANVTENENLSFFNQLTETINDISTTLVSNSIMEAQKVFKNEMKTSLSSPGLMCLRARDRVVKRHQKLSSLYPAAVLDRRALTLDYWSYCRNICSIEKNRTDNNSTRNSCKRNNRFSHYLKTTKVMSGSDSFDVLADSLSFK